MASTKAQVTGYPSASRISDSDCYPAYSASLKCKPAWNRIPMIRVNVNNTSMSTKNARQKRGKHGLNAIVPGGCFRERTGTSRTKWMME